MDVQGDPADDLGDAHYGRSLLVFSVQISVDDSLDEVADWRFLVVHDVTRADAVGGDEYFGMKPRPEEVNGNHGRALRLVRAVERLAEQHLASLQRRMAVAADRVADD